MKDKRISLRFRADNERDMEAWKMLETKSQSDEPELLGEDALDFLDIFG